MNVYASIRDRLTWIVGEPYSFWHGAESTEPGVRQIPFGFEIADAGAGNYLLIYFSLDHKFSADTWHMSLDEAYDVAEEQFGITRSEWETANPSE